MNTKLINYLQGLPGINLIDFHFADFICKKVTDISEEDHKTLFLVTLCLSYYANQQHSVLPLKELQDKKVLDFFAIDESALELNEEDAQYLSDLHFDFSNYRDWTTIFSSVIGDEENKDALCKSSIIAQSKVLPIIINSAKGFLYLNKYCRAEITIAEFIKRRSQATLTVTDALKARVKELCPKEEDPNNWQQVAAFLALRSSFCVISGGPGTGKTTTVSKILALLIEQNDELKIDLVAPTGKAADRLGEAIRGTKSSRLKNLPEAILEKIPENASTIHRYLGYHGGSKDFRFNANNRTESDILLIDEASMVALPLFQKLMSALSDNCRIILLGDKDQLTAVETGNVLGDLTTASDINSFSKDFCQEYQNSFQEKLTPSKSPSLLTDITIKLEFSHRFDANSGIGVIAGLINNAGPVLIDEEVEIEARAKDEIEFSAALDKFQNQIKVKPIPAKALQDYLVPPKSTRDANKKIIPPVLTTRSHHFFAEYKKLLKEFKQNKNAQTVLDFLNTYRILCATRRGKMGSEAINELISKKVFNNGDKKIYNGRCIMIKKNSRELNLYNGDVGVVLYNGETPTVYFPGIESPRAFSPTILPEYETAFAMTIHKSQGSEYQYILMLLPEEENKLLTKELIYTGLTRAKPKENSKELAAEINCSLERLIAASRNKTQRFSGLAERLK